MTPAGSPFILAIEPDTRQADVLSRLVADDVRAEIKVVDSRDAAIAALATRVPEVILLTALLSPRDEEELVAHLRTLEGADHVQTHTLPMLASGPLEAPANGGGLFGRFKRKKEREPVAGCDPSVFAEEVRGYLARAAEMRQEAINAAEWAPAPHQDKEPNWASNEGIEAELARARAAQDEHPSMQAPEETAGPADPWTYRPAYQHAEARQQPAADATIEAEPAPMLDDLQLADFERDLRAPATGQVEAEREAAIRAEQDREEESQNREADEQRAAIEVERERIRREAVEEDARLAREAAERETALQAERERLRRDAEEEKTRLAREADERERAERKAERERRRRELEEEQERLRRVGEEQRLAAEAERERMRRAADEEQARLRREAEAEKVRLRREAEEAQQRAADAEARRQDEARRRREIEEAAAAERAASDAAEAAERAREEERQRLEDEQRRIEAEQAAERERLLREAEAAAQRAHEAERQRLEEARLRREAEEAAQRERLVKEARAAAERARELERQKFEEERRRREAADAAERERLRLEARAAAERARQAELERLQVEQARRDAEEAAERERLLREAEEAAERAREEERLRLEAEQREREAREAAERERLRREAEAAAELAVAAERKRQEEETRRRAAEEAAARERELRAKEKEAARKRRTTPDTNAPVKTAAASNVTPFPVKKVNGHDHSVKPAEPAKPAAEKKKASVKPAAKSRRVSEAPVLPTPAASDPFADFRASVVGASAESIFRLMPIERFAKGGRSLATKAEQPEPQDEISELMKGLMLPLEVARFDYPRQCRIRRVRVLAPPDPLPETPGPVIVSRRALGELRQTSR